jgi:hypothetical protein
MAGKLPAESRQRKVASGKSPAESRQPPLYYDSLLRGSAKASLFLVFTVGYWRCQPFAFIPNEIHGRDDSVAGI